MNPVLRDWPLPIDRKVVYEEILNKITQTREWIDRIKRNGIEFNKEFPEVNAIRSYINNIEKHIYTIQLPYDDIDNVNRQLDNIYDSLENFISEQRAAGRQFY